MQRVVQKRLGIQASETRFSSDYFGVFSQVGLVKGRYKGCMATK